MTCKSRVASTLEVYSCRVKVGRNGFDGFRSHVSVADKCVKQPCFMRQLRAVVSVFHEDGGFSVGIADSLTPSVLGGLHHFLGWKRVARDFMVLAYHPVVAELAAEIAACSRNRHDECAWVEVAERFFADGVHACGDGFAIVEGVEGAALVFSDQAESLLRPSLIRHRLAHRVHFTLPSCCRSYSMASCKDITNPQRE